MLFWADDDRRRVPGLKPDTKPSAPRSLETVHSKETTAVVRRPLYCCCCALHHHQPRRHSPDRSQPAHRPFPPLAITYHYLLLVAAVVYAYSARYFVQQSRSASIILGRVRQSLFIKNGCWHVQELIMLNLIEKRAPFFFSPIPICP